MIIHPFLSINYSINSSPCTITLDLIMFCFSLLFTSASDFDIIFFQKEKYSINIFIRKDKEQMSKSRWEAEAYYLTFNSSLMYTQHICPVYNLYFSTQSGGFYLSLKII